MPFAKRMGQYEQRLGKQLSTMRICLGLNDTILKGHRPKYMKPWTDASKRSRCFLEHLSWERPH